MKASAEIIGGWSPPSPPLVSTTVHNAIIMLHYNAAWSGYSGDTANFIALL